MASIKPIDSTSVHRIQSGQVIVDLCSVVKELVENAVDAGATQIDVRFKSHGLEAIEVADNGAGISKEDYESVALKHYTSKLRDYDDLAELNTFGFRGEALSSLCALSDVHVITAQEHEAPKGTRLDFEQSGKLKDSSTVAAQKGTTVYVETIFKNLPVRRQELTKNIKREYQKVLALLEAYACISTKARVSVSNVAAKGKKTIVFSTKPNQTTRENIVNVYGTKTTALLMPLDMQFDMQPTSASTAQASTQVRILGHVSKPIVGQGRQTSDRQMFFVNGRPCILPQVAKAMNEVYKTYNLSQSPFIFADLQLDTNAYDVNVSPDKRTIMLHEQGDLLESLKAALTELFDNQQQSVPQAKGTPARLPAFSPLTVRKPLQATAGAETASPVGGESSNSTDLPIAVNDSAFESGTDPDDDDEPVGQGDLVQKLFLRRLENRSDPVTKPSLPQGPVRLTVAPDDAEDIPHHASDTSAGEQAQSQGAQNKHGEREESLFVTDEHPGQRWTEEGANDGSRPGDASNSASSPANSLGDAQDARDMLTTSGDLSAPTHQSGQSTEPLVMTAREKLPEEQIPSVHTSPLKSTPGPVQNAFDRMRPHRTPSQQAIITIGDETTTAMIGSSTQSLWSYQTETKKVKSRSRVVPKRPKTSLFQHSLKAFAAPGSQLQREAEEESSGSDVEKDVRGRVDSDEDAMQDDGVEAASIVASEAPKMTRTTPQNLFRGESDEEDLDTDVENSDRMERTQTDLEADLSEDESDGEYLDESAKKAKEDARVAKLIKAAEDRAARPNENSVKRAERLLTARNRTATARLLCTMCQNTNDVLAHGRLLSEQEQSRRTTNAQEYSKKLEDVSSAEERLSLTVSKTDFGQMRIAGQFNLGFIIAVRPASELAHNNDASHAHSELFIIDQHASDEKFNFERLQATTIVQNQPLVHKQVLDLTAIEEEIIMENQDTLKTNGFEIEVDESGACPVGKRCTLLRLPMSKEVTFSLRDLEELIALLSDSPQPQLRPPPSLLPPLQQGGSPSLTPALTHSSSSFLTPVIRPSAVRKMFAMRACRSSVMIGKTLNAKQMSGLVANMGRMEKPWNCPHGRPTMRHLYSFGQWSGWSEGDGIVGMREDDDFAKAEARGGKGPGVDWDSWLGTESSEDEASSESHEESGSASGDEMEQDD